MPQEDKSMKDQLNFSKGSWLAVSGVLGILLTGSALALDPTQTAVRFDQDLVLPLMPDAVDPATPVCIDDDSGLLVAGCAAAVGPAGADGKTVLNGAVAPTTEGVDGDFYIDTTANMIYGPKTAGVWGSGTSLVGPPGTPGMDGALTGRETVIGNAVTINNKFSSYHATASCPLGKLATGGGYRATVNSFSNLSAFHITYLGPDEDAKTWRVEIRTGGTGVEPLGITVTANVVCFDEPS